MKRTLLLTALFVSAWMSAAAVAQAGTSWVIKKDAWTDADEKNFSNFVESIYESKCRTVDSCMKGPGNWYRDRDPEGITWSADCGRFPYLLRVYFAFHNNLPFQGARDANRRDPNDPNPVVKYSARGNVITRRAAATTGADGYSFIRRTVNAAYTAVYRVDSRLDVPTGQYSDLYHVKINRKYIRPGTVVYDPNGHVATVAKVTSEGKVILLDSHPDNTVSRVPYTGAFQATSQVQAGGFKNWRPVRLVGATKGASGELVGGKVAVPSNAETPGFSLEQFLGDQPNSRGTFGGASWSTSEGVLKSSQYIDVVRARLSVGEVNYDALKEVRDGVSTLCSMFQERADSVRVAINKNIDSRNMPGGRLPGNIYGTDGEWEEFSTPSRDARLKTAAAEFRTLVERIVKLGRSGSSKVTYRGSNLVGDMLRAHDQAAADCSLSYTKSNGSTQSVSYESAIQRLYRMSFDPYHCVELRWGASSASELASCATNDGTKLAWYKAEQRLRNSLDRKYDKQMGWSLAELQNGADEGVGADKQTPVDARAVLIAAGARDSDQPQPAPPSEPQPEPQPEPPPAPAPVPPSVPMVDLCSGQFSGRLSKDGDAANVELSKSSWTLSVDGTDYSGRGRCTTVSNTQAKFRFVLDDDSSYVFTGTVTLKGNGKVVLSADELKRGSVIDHLTASRSAE